MAQIVFNKLTYGGVGVADNIGSIGFHIWQCRQIYLIKVR